MWALGDDNEADLRELALRELQAVGGKEFRSPDFEEAGDRTNTVRVTVGRGGTVRDVHLRGDWRREIGGHGIGSALLEAYENANLAMLNSIALASLAEEQRREAEGPEADRREAERREAERRGRQAELQSAEYVSYIPEADISQIWQMLSDVEDLMYRTEKQERAGGGETRTVYGPFGFLSARCSGGAIVGITADLTRVDHADGEQLRQEALELFHEWETLRTC